MSGLPSAIFGEAFAGPSKALSIAINDAGDTAPPATRPVANRLPGPSSSSACALRSAPALRPGPLGERADHAADEDRRRRRQRQVGADRERQRARRRTAPWSRPETTPTSTNCQSRLWASRPLISVAISVACGAGYLSRADQVPCAARAGRAARIGQPDDHRRGDHADQQADLLRARRRADQEAGLEVLRRRAGVGGGDADHRRPRTAPSAGRRRPSSRCRRRRGRSPSASRWSSPRSDSTTTRSARRCGWRP